MCSFSHHASARAPIEASIWIVPKDNSHFYMVLMWWSLVLSLLYSVFSFLNLLLTASASLIKCGNTKWPRKPLWRGNVWIPTFLSGIIHSRQWDLGRRQHEISVSKNTAVADSILTAFMIRSGLSFFTVRYATIFIKNAFFSLKRHGFELFSNII